MPVKRGGHETRQMVKRLTELGVSAPEISKLLEISRQSVHQHLQKLRKLGEINTLENRGELPIDEEAS